MIMIITSETIMMKAIQGERSKSFTPHLAAGEYNDDDDGYIKEKSGPGN